MNRIFALPVLFVAVYLPGGCSAESGGPGGTRTGPGTSGVGGSETGGVSVGSAGKNGSSAVGGGGLGGGVGPSGGAGGSSFGGTDSGGFDASDSGSIDDAFARPDTTSSGVADSSVADPGTSGDGVREIGPTYKDAPEIVAQAGVPKGKLIRFTIGAGTSKIFPKAPDRGVAVYVPSQYVAGTLAPVMIVQDGDNFFGFVSLLSATLDNLISSSDPARKLPPIVAVFANNGGGDAQGSERGLEYDTVSGVYAEWVDQELLPRAEMETKTQLPAQPVTFTHDPEGRGALGGSSGGAASFSMMWWHPDLFRRAVTYSGSFVAQEFPINPAHPLGAWNYHEDQDNDDGGIIAKQDPIEPIRVWLECGTNDNDVGSTQYPHYDMQFANQRMEFKLAKKGYHVHLDHGAGAGHVDSRVIRQTLPEAMLWAWRGYPVK